MKKTIAIVGAGPVNVAASVRSSSPVPQDVREGLAVAAFRQAFRG